VEASIWLLTVRVCLDLIAVRVGRLPTANPLLDVVQATGAAETVEIDQVTRVFGGWRPWALTGERRLRV
jgi:hypothetical protein